MAFHSFLVKGVQIGSTTEEIVAECRKKYNAGFFFFFFLILALILIYLFIYFCLIKFSFSV